MITGVTSSGFEFSIEESTLDNMELLDALEEMSEENTLALSKVLDLILGKEQKKKLYEHLRTEDGRVPVSKVNDEIMEIFAAYKDPGKN